MNTRQLLSVGIDIGTTTTQVIFSHLELVNRAAVSQVPRYEFIKQMCIRDRKSTGPNTSRS